MLRKWLLLVLFMWCLVIAVNGLPIEDDAEQDLIVQNLEKIDDTKGMDVTKPRHPHREKMKRRLRRARQTLHNLTEPLRRHKAGIAAFAAGTLVGFGAGSISALATGGNPVVAGAVGAAVADITGKEVRAHYKRKAAGTPLGRVKSWKELKVRVKEHVRNDTASAIVAAAGGIVGSVVGKYVAAQAAPAVAVAGDKIRGAVHSLSAGLLGKSNQRIAEKWTEQFIRTGTGMATGRVVRNTIRGVVSH